MSAYKHQPFTTDGSPLTVEEVWAILAAFSRESISEDSVEKIIKTHALAELAAMMEMFETDAIAPFDESARTSDEGEHAKANFLKLGAKTGAATKAIDQMEAGILRLGVDPTGKVQMNIASAAAASRREDPNFDDVYRQFLPFLVEADPKGVQDFLKLAYQPKQINRNQILLQTALELYQGKSELPTKGEVRSRARQKAPSAFPADNGRKHWDPLWERTGLIDLLPDGKPGRPRNETTG